MNIVKLEEKYDAKYKPWAVRCQPFSRGCNPFWWTLQRWSIIYIESCQNQLITLYMITLRTLSAKQIVIGDILDARLKSENNDSMTILSSGCMKVIQLRAGLNSDNSTQKFWGGQLASPERQKNCDIQSKIFHILLKNTPSFECSVIKASSSKARLKIQWVVEW